MDGRKLLPILVLIISACELPKKATKTEIIDDSNSKYSKKICYGQAIPNRYIVRWKNGEVSIINGLNKTQIQAQFLDSEKNEIDIIEQDRNIKLNFIQEQNINLPIDSWGQINIEVQSVWDQNILGSEVPVAVIDAGVDILHPQLQNQIFINQKEIPDNSVDDDNNGLVDDYNGYDFFSKNGRVVPVGIHGTHVAGIIAADGLIGPIQGLAPRAKILPLNFMDHDRPGGSMGDAILAIEYAASRGVKVINASWGGSVCSTSLKKSIEALNEKNILFVAAAGNEGSELDTYPEFPAAYRTLAQLTVGAIMPSHRMAGFSNYSEKYVDLMAPGSMIWSTTPESNYEALSGTSMAAPFVSGAAALLWSKSPNAKLTQIKDALLRSVDIGDYANVTKGRLNVKRAVQFLNVDLE
jgi:subtilisin family serine protease